MSDVNFPYAQSYKKIPAFFEAIQKAAVPEKFTNKFLYETLEFKGTNDRPLATLLKNLGFIESGGNPTQKYFDYKNKDVAPTILGESVIDCYEELYKKDENFHNLSDEKIKGHFESTTGKESNNKVLNYMVKTFISLKNIASFNKKPSSIEINEKVTTQSTQSMEKPKDFVLSHTVVINLPSTTDQKVYDVLFKSMKENLL